MPVFTSHHHLSGGLLGVCTGADHCNKGEVHAAFFGTSALVFSERYGPIIEKSYVFICF